MDLSTLYKEKLHFQKAHFELIDHEDTLVATVFKITQPNGEKFILKICSRTQDYLHEAYFLTHFRSKIPVPRIIKLLPPKDDLYREDLKNCETGKEAASNFRSGVSGRALKHAANEDEKFEAKPTALGNQSSIASGIHGAILMECLPGTLLNPTMLTNELCYELGTLLGTIHLDPVEGYGDLTEPKQLSFDPRVPFTQKFDEGMAECQGHLPNTLLKKCRRYYNNHIDLLLEADGPCIVHRDFRPGNIIVDQGKTRGIIDWSSARGGVAEEDFCILECDESPMHPSHRQSFLSGYAQIRKVPEYHRILPLLRLSKAVGVIGFTVKRGTWKHKGSKIYQLHRQYIEENI
ncbi:MAG: hypothetical protein RL235_210 [Chlamydiota bacterium]|jgi:Ser/Thr protein kinase RdoA (MazF antagonist)